MPKSVLFIQSAPASWSVGRDTLLLKIAISISSQALEMVEPDGIACRYLSAYGMTVVQTGSLGSRLAPGTDMDIIVNVFHIEH